MAVFVFILGIIAFLLIEHPIAFWCVFVPLIIVFVFTVVNFLTGRRGHIGNLLMILIAFLTMIVSLVIVATPEPCEHKDMVTMYSFSTHDSTVHSSVRPYCRDCDKRFEYSLFKGTLVDQSYLSALIENSDGYAIVPGEYYTITATAPRGFTAHSSGAAWLNCSVESEDFIVFFTAQFREEFAELVSSVGEGAEITFRGRFYDEGCEFVDCELITE